MNEKSVRATCLAIFILVACIGNAAGQVAMAPNASTPPRLATLMESNKSVPAGDLLRTTRIFPNWNLNCEVLLSQGRHLCAVEDRSVDGEGRPILSWSIALTMAGSPVLVFMMPTDLSMRFGVRMTIGAFTSILLPSGEDCTPVGCQIIAPFDTALRALVASQDKIIFTVMRGKNEMRIIAPLEGLSEALDMARRDPIGLLATQRRELAAQAVQVNGRRKDKGGNVSASPQAR